MRRTSSEYIQAGGPIVFGSLIFFSFVQLIQTAVVVGGFNSIGYPSDSIRDQTRFLLFTSMWSLLFASLYTFGFIRPSGSFIFSVASHGVFIFLTWLFWLAGTSALTHTLGGVLHCSLIPGLAYCNTLNSIEAFGWICWVISTVLLGAISFSMTKDGVNFGTPLQEV